MDVRYTYDVNIIANSVVYFLRIVLIVINAFETIGQLLLVQCALEQTAKGTLWF